MVDVTVIGGGLSGLAVSLHLAKAGLTVVCIEPQKAMREPVGESLDWSSPRLLRELGFPMADLVEQGVATYKRGVTLRLKDGAEQKYYPRDWVGRPPFNIELRTLHVDRTQLDSRLFEMALAQGVTVVPERAVGVERQGDQLTAVRTAEGRSYSGRWFVDASGFASSLLGREFRIPASVYGPRKVAIWTYFDIPAGEQGTTLYADAATRDCLEWIWEIPITSTVASVGYVATAQTVMRARKEGHTISDILAEQLLQYPRFKPLLASGWRHPPKAVTYTCRTYERVAGPNWLLIGEAASLVDPITANGVTAALRHAREAAAVIIRARARNELPARAQRSYTCRLLQMAKFFNCGIFYLAYDWPVRLGVGLPRAARIYTIGAWSLNALYARLEPRRPFPSWLFGGFLKLMRAAARAAHALCRRRALQAPRAL